MNLLLLLATAALAQPIPPQFDVAPLRHDEQPQQELPTYNTKLSTSAVVGYSITAVVGTTATVFAVGGVLNLFGHDDSAVSAPPPSPTVQFH